MGTSKNAFSALTDCWSMLLVIVQFRSADSKLCFVVQKKD